MDRRPPVYPVIVLATIIFFSSSESIQLVILVREYSVKATKSDFENSPYLRIRSTNIFSDGEMQYWLGKVSGWNCLTGLSSDVIVRYLFCCTSRANPIYSLARFSSLEIVSLGQAMLKGSFDENNHHLTW